MKHFLVLAAASASFSTISVAQTERDLDSHVHGAASMNVALADSSVFIELSSPWNNLVGFEHAPQTEEQHGQVDAALDALNNPSQLFAFNGGNCSVVEVDLDSGMASDEHDAHGDDHDDDHKDEHHDDEAHGDDHKDEHHDDDAHGDDHKDEHHDDDAHGDDHKDEHHDDDAHGDDHDDHDDHADHGDESTHSALLVAYSFNCENIDELSAIDLTLFSLWSGFEDLDVQLIGDKGQALAELNPGNTTLSLDSIK